jgi:hypothetical protein
VPVKVHPSEPKRVAIDWDHWDATIWEDPPADDQPARVDPATAQANAEADVIAQLLASGRVTEQQAESMKRMMAMSAAGELDDVPPITASPRESLDWQLAKGLLDQATYDAIIAANPKMK